jgi:quercetin dioxygenase-like cupin family protein
MAAVTDPVQVAPEVYTVLFENERVRVLDVRMKAGDKSPMHTHPDSVWYVLSPAKARFTAGNGASQEADLPIGVVWLDAQAHAAENIGTAELRALAIELK